MSNFIAAQARTINALHASLFAASVNPEQAVDGRLDRGAIAAHAVRPSVTETEVVRAAEQAMEWHKEMLGRLTAEISDREARGGNPLLLAQAIDAKAHHEREVARIAAELAALVVPALVAAE
jgi:hypothetical protein